MKAKQINLARAQLDATLEQFRSLRPIAPPRKGWIRAIRDALGMTGEQLAKRLGINKQRVSRIEQDEKLGNITLKTLRNVAEALDCEFVYGFVPRQSLETTLRNQARSVAAQRMARSDQQMRLEKQELSREEKEKVLENMITEMINTMPRSLWDER
ncbi:MAG: mobile mystery protein A [Sedimentisphaerales bacterium]|nr:mobile mystery protein A [Sedimentisphaerales bacterium]